MTQLYVVTEGDPDLPAIVFLHGGGLSGRMWQPQLQELSRDFYCLAPDLPGHGRSAAIRPFTLRMAAAEVGRLIHDLIPGQRAHLVGLSIGAAVGLELLRAQPEVVARAVLSGTTPKLGRRLVQVTNILNAVMFKVLSREQLAKATLRSLGVPATYQALFSEDFAAIDSDLLRDVYAASEAVQIPQGPVPPALVVVGEREPAISKRHARAISQGVEGVTGRLVTGVGHAWNLEEPALFNAVVRAWVTGEALPERLVEME